ncbi:MAG: right-handed parallel beta-helix repeat-containing protein [Phycisphaerales bacterium]|nr:MAG: right-handed parallel beta-helix repeat-containing protein [Phycisphaerales bacterium]
MLGRLNRCSGRAWGRAIIACLLPVGVSADATADEIHVPDDWPFIQQAISVATDGDVIIAHPGQYTEHVDLMGKAITLRSIDPTDPGIVAGTRIVGPSSNPTVSCINGEGPNTLISGFTITHLSPAASGSGMHIDQASPEVTYCVFYDNHAAEDGGGMYVYIGGPTIRHCTFSENSAGENGGGISLSSGGPTIEHCTFSGNSAGYDGGGMYSYFGDQIVTDCDFTDNTAEGDGGALSATIGSPRVSGCSFTSNAADTGGGLHGYLSSLTVEDCDFTTNVTVYGGGGMFLDGNEDVIIRRTTFTGNSATGGGAILNTLNYALVDVTDCTFSLNSASTGKGGAIYTSPDGRTTLADCTFDGGPDAEHDSITGMEWEMLAPYSPPTGACCLNGGCIVATEAACTEAGGTYMGDETTCADVDCPDPCPADVNDDETVNIDDIFEVLAQWGPCP